MSYAHSLGPQFEMLSVVASKSRARQQRFHPVALIEDPLIVALDMDSSPAEEDPIRRAVEGLATSPLFQLWRYSDDGPPPDTPRVTPNRQQPETLAAKGWLQITPQARVEDAGARPVVTHVVEGSLRSGHHQAHFVWAHPETWSPGVLYPGEAEAHAALIRAGLSGFSELLISSRAGVGTKQRAIADGDGVVAGWEAGAAILGRLARESGEVIPIAPHQTASERLFHALAAEDLLPNLRTATRVMLERGVNPDHLLALRGRIAQTFLARDDLALALSTSPKHRSALRQIDALDRVLIFSLAAFDELAHLTSAAFGIELAPTDVKWNRESFLRALSNRPGADRIVDLYDWGKRPAGMLRVLRYLRNMVHGTGLNEMSVLTDPAFGLIADLSAPAPRLSEFDEVALDMTAYRGWGIHFVADRIFVNSEALAEKVAFETYRLMDRTLQALSTASLPAVGPPQTSDDLDDARVIRLHIPAVGNVSPGDISAHFGLLRPRRRHEM